MSYNVHLNDARKALTEKKFKTALDLYLIAEKNAPSALDRAELWAEISWTYYYLHEFLKAIESSEKVMEINPDYKIKEDIFKIQGFSYLAIKQEPLAEKMLILSLQHNDTDPKQNYVKYELGKLFFKKGDYDQAFPLLKESIPYFETENFEYALSIYFFMGFIYFYLNNYDDSRKMFIKLFEKSDSDIRRAAANFGFAFIEFKQKNYLNVISLCEKILEFDDNFFDKESVAFLTAASYYYLGRRDIFEKYYERIQESYPDGKYYSDLENLYNSIDHT